MIIYPVLDAPYLNSGLEDPRERYHRRMITSETLQLFSHLAVYRGSRLVGHPRP